MHTERFILGGFVMFHDERINAECGKIYKRGILLAVLVTLAYALSRTVTLAIQGTLQVVFTYTEFVILLYGGGILLTGIFRFYKDRDERVEFEKHTFYKKAAKSFVITVFGAYILTIPFTTAEMLGGQPHNHLLILLEVIGCLYLFCAFKSKDININYSFIAENGWQYYRRVLLNIGVLSLGLFPPFVLSASWELVLHNSPAGAITVLLAYVSSALGLSIEYLFISVVEKASYNSLDGCRFALGTRIAMLVCLAVEFSLFVMQGIYVHFVTGNLQEIPNAGSIIAYVSQQRLRIEMLLAVLIGLAISQMISQIQKETLLYTVCRIQILILGLSAIEATLSSIWYRILSDEAIRMVANTVTPILNFVSFLITLTMWILFVYALIKELRCSKILWLIPVLHVLVNAVTIFLTSQNLIRAASYCDLSVQLLCLVLVAVLLWRYRGFQDQNNYNNV